MEISCFIYSIDILNLELVGNLGLKMGGWGRFCWFFGWKRIVDIVEP